MIKRAGGKALLVFLSFALTLLLLEGGLRLLGETDEDGQFTVLGHALQPYAVPVSQFRERIDAYLEHEQWSTVIYEPWQGWVFSPNREWPEGGGSFTTNSAGLRATREYSLTPPPDTLRIAAFGDSFTASVEVRDEGAWTQLLEARLLAEGIRAEALNFGVSAYGMGQAYLRWQHLGVDYQPDIVIFGLQPENLKRNVNVFRQLLYAPGLPFTKPRYALLDGRLELLNSPALPPTQLLDAFESFASHPLAPWEYYYASRQVADQWWSGSRLLSLAHAALGRTQAETGIYAEGSEGGMLGQAILSAFADHVRARGSEFLVLHLPLRSHLIRRFEGNDPPYKFLLDDARESYHYIAMEEVLLPPHVEMENWGPTVHYGAPIAEIVGATVADWIANCVRSRACQLSRFDDPSALEMAD